MAITLGSATPTRLVALFHGLGGSARSLEPLALRWAAELPKTCFVLLEGNGNWFLDFPKRDTFDSEEAWVEKVVDTVRASMSRADATIDELLLARGLTDCSLVLGGFSQGAAMSAYTGLRRGCLGVLPMGGPCPPRQQLLPDNSSTRVCLVSGDQDSYAPHELITECFAKYVPQSAVDGVHIIPGLDHRINEDHATLGLSFLQSCGCG